MRARIAGLQEELGNQAGLDSRLDSIKVGGIQALKDILEIDFEETSKDG